MRRIIREWPGPSADGLGPRMALNTARPSTDPRLAPNKWEKIPQGSIDGLIKRMSERMQAVLDANGGHTKW